MDGKHLAPEIFHNFSFCYFKKNSRCVLISLFPSFNKGMTSIGGGERPSDFLQRVEGGREGGRKTFLLKIVAFIIFTWQGSERHIILLSPASFLFEFIFLLFPQQLLSMLQILLFCIQYGCLDTHIYIENVRKYVTDLLCQFRQIVRVPRCITSCVSKLQRDCNSLNSLILVGKLKSD